MKKLTPLISSLAVGTLGVMQLPRTWEKVLLEASGRLKQGYPGYGQGYDMMAVTGIGLDPEAMLKFLRENRPTYPEFEAWIKQQPGVNLTKANIYKVNQSILGYVHGDEERKRILGLCGYPDDGSINPCAANLNELDDWMEFHADLKEAGDLPDESAAPAAEPAAETEAAHAGAPAREPELQTA